MKKFLPMLLMAVLLLTACGKDTKTADFNIIVATDLHYISPTLHDNGEYFTAVVDSADGKVTRYAEELTEAFLDEVIKSAPDALVLTGDLTFNGALESHAALAEKLKTVENAGIPVLVLPGNHDMYNSNAARFSDSEFKRVSSADEESFGEIYADFGFSEAESRDEASLSYTYRLNDSTLILMLDYNTPQKPCGISEETLSWVDNQLKTAKKAGDTVIAAGHQNLYRHSIFDYGYVISGHEELKSIFEKYGVELCLSGHLHTQHIVTEGKVTEIVTSALSVSPCHYGIVKSENGVLSYETRETDVSAWAAGQGSGDENLLNFKSFAEYYFGGRNDSNYPGAGGEMMEFLRAINAAYFSGHLENAEALDPDGSITAMWERDEPLMGFYLSSIRSEFGQNYNYWSNEKNPKD